MLNIGKWFGQTYENKCAVNPSAVTHQKLDVYRPQIRNPVEFKPDGYKSSQSSAIRFQYNRNLNDK